LADKKNPTKNRNLKISISFFLFFNSTCKHIFIIYENVNYFENMSNSTSFTLWTTVEVIEEVKNIVKNNKNYPTIASYINKAIYFYNKRNQEQKSIEFMYFICIPLGLFLGCIGLSLHLASLFFYIISVIFGIYLMVFVYLFYNKYFRGNKVWQ